ncbi:hypothetical protein A1Q1_06205 [Trichosporon asahii var. asahii CBS 2479]|uniref:Uncharacterized protein n=1 Tax=Trichosporon asahii var. asahii (strain ATCC 90039 / CBS 2479 / JCM 2466 / KCTC 7840 / NBRC 103889/ NCYC 2677 / UAMH 7654) TaxID=1186058 RepID=J5Q3N6_TRIAS|nr:hypothetical protein A1Q1_06205 [Trichosporon asahii var. asahii CBS 2479]EJT45308.1 hypothetical protein A1Q1_06205 [Trichosporon asahii var. asahii CBS 2479]
MIVASVLWQGQDPLLLLSLYSSSPAAFVEEAPQQLSDTPSSAIGTGGISSSCWALSSQRFLRYFPLRGLSSLSPFLTAPSPPSFHHNRGIAPE